MPQEVAGLFGGGPDVATALAGIEIAGCVKASRIRPVASRTGLGKLPYRSWRRRMARSMARRLARGCSQSNRLCPRGLYLPQDASRTTRRSAIRAFVRAITDGVAMKLSGHKTRSAFDRYNIISETDLKDAAAKLNASHPDSSVTVGTQEGAQQARVSKIS